MCREARRAAAADDLLQALRLADGSLAPGRWAAFAGGARAAGLAARLEAALEAARPVTRGRSAVLLAGLRLPGRPTRSSPSYPTPTSTSGTRRWGAWSTTARPRPPAPCCAP